MDQKFKALRIAQKKRAVLIFCTAPFFYWQLSTKSPKLSTANCGYVPRFSTLSNCSTWNNAISPQFHQFSTKSLWICSTLFHSSTCSTWNIGPISQSIQVFHNSIVCKFSSFVFERNSSFPQKIVFHKTYQHVPRGTIYGKLQEEMWKTPKKLSTANNQSQLWIKTFNNTVINQINYHFTFWTSLPFRLITFWTPWLLVWQAAKFS